MNDRTDSKNRSITLEEVLVAFQKSLARSCKNVVAVGKSSEEILTGNRTLYNINSLEVELHADVSMHDAKGIFGGDRIFMSLVDPARNKPTNTTVRFRVESHPVEAVTGAGISLSQFKPLEWRGQNYGFILRVTDQTGRSAPDCPVLVRFTAAEGRGKALEWRIATNPLGNIVFSVNAASGEIVLTEGKMIKAGQDIKLSFQKAKVWYIGAECVIPIADEEQLLRSETYAVHGLNGREE